METPEWRAKPRERLELETQQNADDRVWKLMDIITAEFESDPNSVQCFDLNIVKEAIALVKARKKMNDPFNPFKKRKLGVNK